jgi:hypothetical protein
MSDAFGAAAVQKQQQMKAMQEQAYQQAVAQAIAQRQQAEQQAYSQAVAQYQAAEMQAAQEYMQQKQAQAMIEQQMAQMIMAKQMEAAKMVMLKQAVEQALARQFAEQVKQKMAIQIQEAMVQKAVGEAVMRLGMQEYINEAAQQQFTAQMIMATRHALGQVQQAQMQAAQQYVMQKQMQEALVSKVEQLVQANLQQKQKETLKSAAEQLLMQRVAAQMQQRAQVQVGDEMLKSVVGEAAQILGYNALQKEAAQYQAAKSQAPAVLPVDEVEDIVDIAEVWTKLETTAKPWALLIDDQAKLMTVKEFSDRFRKKGVRIQKPPDFYAKMVDDMASQNPQLLENPFPQVLQMLAVMEYDFDNGTDRDDLARKLLGPAYQRNRQRLGK